MRLAPQLDRLRGQHARNAPQTARDSHVNSSTGSANVGRSILQQDAISAACEKFGFVPHEVCIASVLPTGHYSATHPGHELSVGSAPSHDLTTGSVAAQQLYLQVVAQRIARNNRLHGRCQLERECMAASQHCIDRVLPSELKVLPVAPEYWEMYTEELASACERCEPQDVHVAPEDTDEERLFHTESWKTELREDFSEWRVQDNPVEYFVHRNRQACLHECCLEVGWGSLRRRPATHEKACLGWKPPSPFLRTITTVLAHGISQISPCFGAENQEQGFEERLFGVGAPRCGMTMIGVTALENIRAAMEEINRKGIDGSVVEIGTWRGGAMLLAAAVNHEAQHKRSIHLFDAWGYIPEYKLARGETALTVDITDVSNMFSMFGLEGHYIHYHKGFTNETLPPFANDEEPIAVLRIDCNFYDCHLDTLYYLYDKVAVGGFVIFDDVYALTMVNLCWVEFKEDQGLSEVMRRIDPMTGWFRKERAITTDWSAHARRKASAGTLKGL